MNHHYGVGARFGNRAAPRVPAQSSHHTCKQRDQSHSHYLMQVILHLHLSEALPALYQLVQSLISTDLQQDIHVFMVLEHVLELHYVLVVK